MLKLRKIVIAVLIASMVLCVTSLVKAADPITLNIVSGEEETTTTTVAVTGVSLNKSTLSLAIEEEQTIKATTTPSDATNKDISWSSSDITVATVDNGKITAVAVGTATITATTQDGSYTATCTVTVTKKDETLPQAGITEDITIMFFIVVCIVSAIYAYRKIKSANA